MKTPKRSLGRGLEVLLAPADSQPPALTPDAGLTGEQLRLLLAEAREVQALLDELTDRLGKSPC